MLINFITHHLKKAKYKLLADGTYYGEIPGFRGVWANARNLESCRSELKEVLENWLLLKIRQGDQITGLKIDRRLATRYA